jgi:hypothetical protein
MKLVVLLATSIFFFMLFASCSLPGAAHELRVALPSLPPAWAFLPDLQIRLAWRSCSGELRSECVSPGSSLNIEVERGFPQAILALPMSAGRLLRPAGALYPEALVAHKADESRDELILDWPGGYAGSVALALEGGGYDPCGYDLYRLVDEAIERSGDPWILPPLEAARRLAALGFGITAFKKPKLMDVDLGDSGPWASESPFAAPPSAAPGGTSQIAQLPEGLWRFLGKEEELFVSVDSSGQATLVRRL